MTHDDVSNHLDEAGSLDRAAIPLGAYLAWCANHRLLSDAVTGPYEALVMRVQFREVTGAELAVAACGGTLADEHLTPDGQAFTVRHYARYLEAFRARGGEDPYGVEDQWALYDDLARELTRWLMAFRHGAGRDGGRHGKRWWQLWK